jgi:hypothetical protein
MEKVQRLRADSGVRGLGLILPLAFLLTLAAAFVGLIVAGPKVAAGAAVGCLAATLYAITYVRSHFAARERPLDGRIVSGFGVRLLVVAALALAAWWAGRSVLIAYLAGFALTFPLLLMSQLPRALRDLRSRTAVTRRAT